MASANCDAKMLSEFQEVDKEVIREEINALHDEIHQIVDPIKTAIANQGSRIDGVEEGMNALAARVDKLEANHTQIANVNSKLQSKLDTLENFSRRNNIWILGIEEGQEKGNPTQFVSEVLHGLLRGTNGLKEPVILDQAHRTIAPKPCEGEQPRPFIAGIHYFQEKERILRLAREKGQQLTFQGKRIHIFPWLQRKSQ